MKLAKNKEGFAPHFYTSSVNRVESCAKSAGFTLLETIVALSVLITAVIGPMSLAQQTIHAQVSARNNLIAANLAQEGIELIRNYRSNNILRNSETDNPLDYWIDGMEDACILDPNGCAIDAYTLIDSDSLPTCSYLNGCALGFDSVRKLFLHCAPGVDANCEKTNIKRSIVIENIGGGPEDPPEIKVTARVSIGDDERVSISTHLINL